MRAVSCTSPSRHRVPGSNEDTCKKKFQRHKYYSDARRLFHFPCQDRHSHCKCSLKVVLVLIAIGTLLTLIQYPEDYITDHRTRSRSQLSSVERWMGDASATDPRYESLLGIKYHQISKVIQKLKERTEFHGVGLLNLNETEITHWKQLLHGVEHVVLHLNPVPHNLTWESIYPEWIDEIEEFEVPRCPSFPMFDHVHRNALLDLIIVKLPCNKSKDWSRDVPRLHLQLVAARLASAQDYDYRVHVLLLTDCFPIPNLFACKELVMRKGNAWLYEPNLRTLRQKLKLPVGSCELAIPLTPKEVPDSGRNSHREAYATILHSVHIYVCGAISVAQSIRMTGSTRDLVILVDETITDYHRKGLESAGWKLRTIERIRNPKAEKDAYNEWNYSKFRLWQLTDYDKIIFIDADLLVLKNIDFLFTLPEVSATGNNATLFNSGVMVLEPSNCTFNLLMEHINEIESYNGGDQGYLNEIFTWWHRIPKHMNFLKNFWDGDTLEQRERKSHLFGANPAELYVLHYLGLKPWACFRDYDCNWNVKILQMFASDVAHTRWWEVHDAMPEELQRFCVLRTKQKAALEWDRREAERENLRDGHWRIKIKDPRLKKCFEDFCFWESMLWHWGETNWTDNAPMPPAITTAASMKMIPIQS